MNKEINNDRREQWRKMNWEIKLHDKLILDKITKQIQWRKAQLYLQVLLE